MPEKIIPFQVSKERCRALFQKYTKRVLYLPRELKDAAYLRNFTGIYMPYYEYDVELGASHIVGKKIVKNKRRYYIENTYKIDASVDGLYCGVPYDASRYYDDEIAARVLPFDMRKERSFRPAFLSGFYADASTVSPGTYFEDAEKTASEDVVAKVSELVKGQDGINVVKKTSRVDTRTRGYHGTMFPIWFLTWRKGGRVAYSVVNGESGKVVSDLPIDMKTFSLGCILISLILFLFLEMLVQPTPLLTSVFSLTAAALMAHSIQDSTKHIFEKQNHIKDKGWASAKAPEVEKERRKARHVSSTYIDIPALFLYMLVMFGYSIISVSIKYGEWEMIAYLIAIVICIYLTTAVVKVLKWHKSIPQWQPSFAILTVAASSLLTSVIILFHPVNDLWYYLGDAICILLLILASTIMLNVYNIGTTRPLPRLFDRKEVR